MFLTGSLLSKTNSETKIAPKKNAPKGEQIIYKLF